VRTVRLSNPSAARLGALFEPLERAARHELRAEGVPSEHCKLTKVVDVRYEGQSYEISLPFGKRVADAFHAAHRRLYGYADIARPVEVVNVRVLATGRGVRRRPPAHEFERPVPPGHHRVRWAGRSYLAAAYQRAHLPSASSLRGPAVIVEFSATTFVPPGWRATVHRTGHLVLSNAR